VLYFTVDYSQRISIPSATFRSWAHQTNIFQYLGVHYVDLIYFLTGATPKRLMAIGTDGTLKQQGVDTYDSVHVTLEWLSPGGHKFVSILNISWVDANVSSALSDQKYEDNRYFGAYRSRREKPGSRISDRINGNSTREPVFLGLFTR